MSFTVPIALFGWPLVVIVLFAAVRPRIAVMIAFMGGWLFLPMASYPIAGLPDYDKMSVTCLSVLLSTFLFDLPRVFTLRPHWLDLPVAVWCLVSLASSVTNGHGAYDGVSAVVTQTVTWGLPYLIGRLYFRTGEDLKELAVGLFIGGLVYVPFCLYEIRMSPRLHTIVYGYNPRSDFAATKRFGGWRPQVFMASGLMVGTWMGMASLAGIWLWFSGTIRRIRGTSAGYLVVILVVTAVLCKSTGALVLLVVGVSVLFLCRKPHLAALFWLIALCPIAYMSVRATGIWSGQEMVSMASSISEDRAQSLDFRLRCESRLAAKAMQRFLLGWGSGSEFRMTEASDGSLQDTTTDMLWCIAFSRTGFVGLAGLTAVLLVPAWLLAWRVSPRRWGEPEFAGAAVIAMLLVLYMIDNLFNAMVNPIFMLCAGGLVGYLANLSAHCSGSTSACPD